MMSQEQPIVSAADCEAILMAMPVAIEVLDDAGAVVVRNPARATLHGYPQQEFASLSVEEFIDPADAGEYRDLFEIAKTGGRRTIECEGLRKGGGRFALEIQAHSFEFRGARHTLLVLHDVTGRKNVVRNLEELRHRNQLILDSAGEGIYGLDNQGFTTFVNPKAAALTGWEAEQLLGKRNHDVVHHTRPDGSHYPREECPIYAAFKDGQVHTVDDELFWRRDGTSFPVEYTSNPIRNDDGELAGAVVTFRDISERRQSEEKLQSALEEINALKQRLHDENIYLREEIKLNQDFEGILGETTAIKRVLSRVEKVAETDATVLILGESGTGKELIARAIHNLSGRRERPLVKVNCAALPPSLIESELFGHRKGAFTGALSDRAGRFELADGGTIFLDEIGELPLELQAKLLRILQEGEFEQIGSQTTRRVDVRVLAATNRDLAARSESGEFRQDLYYRLNVVPVTVPSLRDRREDIPLLAAAFSERAATRAGKHFDYISAACLEEMQEYPWPGNVRELENVIERAVILSPGPKLEIESLTGSAIRDWPEMGSTRLEDVEREHLIRILDSTQWVVNGRGKAAELLDINPSTLRSRMKKLGIRKPSPKHHQ